MSCGPGGKLFAAWEADHPHEAKSIEDPATIKKMLDTLNSTFTRNGDTKDFDENARNHGKKCGIIKVKSIQDLKNGHAHIDVDGYHAFFSAQMGDVQSGTWCVQLNTSTGYFSTAFPPQH